MKFISGCIVGLAAVVLGGLLFIESGLFDTAASVPHPPLIYWVVKTTMVRSVKLRARSVVSPAAFTPQQVMAGFREYRADCIMCHGGPGEAHQYWVNGMTPSPPYLDDASRRWTPGELFWIVRNGIKMTAMPSWGLVHSDREVWNLVAFLEAFPDPETYQRMIAAESAPPAKPSLPPSRGSKMARSRPGQK